MLPALVAAFLLAQPIPFQTGNNLNDPFSGEENVMLLQRTAALDPPKLSPQTSSGKKWEFDWITSVYAKLPGVEKMEVRFRVFSQDRKPENDLAMGVATMDGRLWQLVNHKYKIDHPDMYRGLRMVDEYLCWGGQAGGEQAFGQDVEAGIVRRVNTIYIYDIASFKKPLEMAREVAHEYGHAVLPAIGGFKAPEDWANGYLGEKLFLRWIRDLMVRGDLDSSSVMGVSLAELEPWVAKNVDPLVLDASSHAPNLAVLRSTGPKAMNAYLGLVLYADSILPQETVARSFKLAGKASEYPDALVQACEGVSYTVNLPGMLPGRKLWLPLGKSKVQGGKVLARSGSWAQVQAGSQPLIVLSSG